MPVPRDRVDGYGVAAVSGRYRVGGRWLVTTRIDNLTDESWEQFIGFARPGRTARVGLRYEIDPSPE